jgi:hypothetical protein
MPYGHEITTHKLDDFTMTYIKGLFFTLAIAIIFVAALLIIKEQTFLKTCEQAGGVPQKTASGKICFDTRINLPDDEKQP